MEWNDLTALATAASENELKRIHDLLKKLIVSTKEDVAVKQQKQEGEYTCNSCAGNRRVGLLYKAKSVFAIQRVF